LSRLFIKTIKGCNDKGHIIEGVSQLNLSNKLDNLPLLKGIALRDKVAIVTGAGAGIGKAVAHVLARAGCRIVIGELVLESGEATAYEIEEVGHTAVVVRTNVAIRSDAQCLAERALERFGTIDILVNVAGVYPSALAVDIQEEEWDRVFDVNIKGVFNCCQAVIPTMMSKRSGKIVNIASVDGMQPGIMPGRSGYGNSHYCASKGAVIVFTKCLSAEMAPFGVNVNAISPGWVATGKAMSCGRFEEGLKHVPLGRSTQPEEVAQIILFLVSEAASFMTGENLVFSGGSVMD
jgi:NAD(P)-dependent dehydrogenase (short-subunit alcohol dehydrogenase family)